MHSGLHFNSYRAHSSKTYVKFIEAAEALFTLYYQVAWNGTRRTTRPGGRLETGTLVTRSLVMVTVEEASY